MPLYQYKCDNCNKIYELILPINGRDSHTVCVICKLPSVRRQLSACNYTSTISNIETSERSGSTDGNSTVISSGGLSKPPAILIIDSENCAINNVHISNAEVGIDIQNSTVSGHNIILEDVGEGLRHKNSRIEFENFKYQNQ